MKGAHAFREESAIEAVCFWLYSAALSITKLIAFIAAIQGRSGA